MTNGPSDEQSTMLRARRDLAAAIRRGDYQPNQRLVESELSAALGVSRATLRAVFISLELDNYIVLERNRGARVRQFSPAEALEILVTREILESAAAGLAASKITTEECAELEGLVRQMESANREPDSDVYSACNREFHTRVLAAARQPTLSRFIAATPYPLVMSQYRDLETRHPREGSLREHKAILAALTIRSREAAEAAMRLHLSQTRHGLKIKLEDS